MTSKNRVAVTEDRAETSAHFKAKRVDFILSKVTEAKQRNQRHGQQTRTVQKSEEERKKLSSTVAADEYERMVLVTNKNRDDSLVEARSVEEAIAQISKVEILPQDSHGLNHWWKKDYPRINNGNSKGFRFGFIRFAKIGEARRAISKMNGARIDGSKIGVSFAIYNPRHSFWRKSLPVVHQKHEREDVTSNNLHTVIGVVDEAKLQVLDNCLMGWCKNYTKIGDLASQMQDKGLNGFSLMRAAGNVVLMIFEDSALLRRVKNEQSENLAEWFSRVEPWSESLVVQCHRVWVVCEGIPFHGWNWGTFKNIAARWGELISIDESSQFASSFDRAKLQILTESKVRIDESLSLKVGSNLYEIMVHEVEPSFKPTSWTPEEVDDSPDLTYSLGDTSENSLSGSSVSSSGLNCPVEDVAIEGTQLEEVPLIKSVKSDENSSIKLGLHTMEAVDFDGVSLRASEDVLMMGLFTSHSSSSDAIQLMEDTPVVPPIPGKFRTNRVVKKRKKKKRVLN
ncbi:CCDC124 protein [Hibiscus syriacus]|uniref:CCDC124 protein n=1 Tax=Hibiscus syriacus TaxID=106335 RepID=A0A6A2WUW2_HIBSY|nr:CCDC124 protein [Hibiscus syriacus]